MPVKKVKDFLDNNHVKYTTLRHSPCYTSQEVAACTHIRGNHLAKVVVIKIGDRLGMVVLPAQDHVNFSALQKVVGRNDIDLAQESEFKNKFPECEVGAMPPLGNLYDNMPVYVSDHLAHDYIAFNAGSHSEVVRMAYDDFERLVRPTTIKTTEA